MSRNKEPNGLLTYGSILCFEQKLSFLLHNIWETVFQIPFDLKTFLKHYLINYEQLTVERKLQEKKQERNTSFPKILAVKDKEGIHHLPFCYCFCFEADREILECASSAFVFNKIFQHARSILNILTFSTFQPVVKWQKDGKESVLFEL